MPRGKYPRPPRAAVSTPETAASVQVVAPSPSVVSVASTEAPVGSGRRPQRFADHPRSRDIDSLAGEELREYARSIGMTRRDAAELAEDRLRAGAKAHLAHHFEALTE